MSRRFLRWRLLFLATLLVVSAGSGEAARVEIAYEAELFGVAVRPNNTFRTGDRLVGTLVFDSSVPASLAGSPVPFTAFYNDAIISSELEFPRSGVTVQGEGGTIIVGDNQRVTGSNPGRRDAFEAFGLTSGTMVRQFNAMWDIDRVSLFFDSRGTLLTGDGGNVLDAFDSLALPIDDSRLSLLPAQRVNVSLRRSDGVASAVTGMITSFTVTVPEPACWRLLMGLPLLLAQRARR